MAAAGDDLCIGTVESWLVFRLTGGLHVTDATNASRTALMDIHSGGWDAGLCALFGAPLAALPEIVDCAGRYGETLPELFGAAMPICGMAGDQQAASIGQCCLSPGETKATYGTGAFVLTHTGKAAPVSRHRLLTTVAWQLAGERRYALEGSVFVAGSLIQWLRDALGMLVTAPESEALARSVEDNAGRIPGAGLGRAGRAALAAGSAGGADRAHLRGGPGACRPRGAGGDGAPDPRPDDRLRRRRRGLGVPEGGWRDGRERLAGAGSGGCARARGGAAGVHRDDGAGRGDARRGRGGAVRDLEEAAAMRGRVEHFRPAMAEAARSARLDGWRRALASVLEK